MEVRIRPSGSTIIPLCLLCPAEGLPAWRLTGILRHYVHPYARSNDRLRQPPFGWRCRAGDEGREKAGVFLPAMLKPRGVPLPDFRALYRQQANGRVNQVLFSSTRLPQGLSFPSVLRLCTGYAQVMLRSG